MNRNKRYYCIYNNITLQCHSFFFALNDKEAIEMKKDQLQKIETIICNGHVDKKGVYHGNQVLKQIYP
jgi:hypothetical protein